jgi:hypothetical protein
VSTDGSELMPPARTKRTSKKGTSVSTRPAWPDRFLQELKERGTISAAAAATGVGRRTVYDELARNPDFAKDVLEVREACVEDMEASIFQRGMAGDNTAAIFWLKGNAAEKYGDGLRADQIRQIKETARAEAIGELQREVAALPEEARRIVMDAMRKAAKELTP